MQILSLNIVFYREKKIRITNYVYVSKSCLTTCFWKINKTYIFFQFETIYYTIQYMITSWNNLCPMFKLKHRGEWLTVMRWMSALLFLLFLFQLIDLTASRLTNTRELVNRSKITKTKMVNSRFSVFVDLYNSRRCIGIMKLLWNWLNLEITISIVYTVL